MSARSPLVLLAALLLACDSTPPDPATAGRGGDWKAPERSPVPSRIDCRDAYFCYRTCVGSSWAEGDGAAAAHDGCAEDCEPEVLAGGPAQTELDHWAWWVDAVEVQCEDTWTSECVLEAMVPDLHGDDGDLSGTVLDACLRPRW